jgi:hypothetical protein
MRSDTVELLGRLRASREPEILELIAAAALDGSAETAAWPDVVEPYRWFLARLGDGVKLTGAGYLPPALVVEAMEHLGWAADWFGKANREDIARPVAELRETARQLGLVRVNRGELRVTAAGRRLSSDPVALWQHIAARLPLGRGDVEREAGLLWLLAVAAGRPHADRLVAQGMWRLGWADGRTGAPLDAHQAFAVYRDTWVVLERMGILGRRWSASPRPPAQAAIDLARTALLAERPPTARPATTSVAAFELEVGLRDVDPRVWRRIAVPAAISLRDLHGVLQTAMGWDDAHLYLFAIGGADYGDVEDMDELGDVHAKLADLVVPGDTFRYDYDFGDGWEHDVRVLRATTTDRAHCLEGGGACPPEDCGGPHGYARLLDVLADPAHPEHDELSEWIGRPLDPRAFDAATVDVALGTARRRGRR